MLKRYLLAAPLERWGLPGPDKGKGSPGWWQCQTENRTSLIVGSPKTRGSGSPHAFPSPASKGQKGVFHKKGWQRREGVLRALPVGPWARTGTRCNSHLRPSPPMYRVHHFHARKIILEYQGWQGSFPGRLGSSVGVGHP